MVTILALVMLLSLLVHPAESSDPCQPGGIALTGASSGFVSSPNFPGNFPPNSICIWNITVPSGRIKLSFFNFTFEPNDQTLCSSDDQGARLKITNVAHSSILALCGRSIPAPVYSVGDYLGIQLHTHTNGYSGFNASYETVTDEMLCPNSSQLTDSSGVITSAFYPRKYPSSQDCQWEITATKGNRVKLEVNMNIQECGQSGACTCDFLEILDGFNAADGAPSGKKCGDASSLTYYSIYERLRVQFFSDLDSTNGKGFSATYTQLNYTPPACPTAPIPLSGNGTFSSLHYPFANYPVSKNCYWLITASAGKRIKVTFKHFSMGLLCNPGDCERGNCPYVDLLDGPSTNSPYLARYCTKSVPTTIISSGQQMYVKFYSGFSPDRGFLAEYSETTDEPSPTVTRPPPTTTTTAKPPTTGAAVLTITLFSVILPSLAATMLSP